MIRKVVVFSRLARMAGGHGPGVNPRSLVSLTLQGYPMLPDARVVSKTFPSILVRHRNASYSPGSTHTTRSSLIRGDFVLVIK